MSTENTYIEFYQGLEENLPQARSNNGFYVTTDSGKLWLGNRRIGVFVEDGVSGHSIQQEGNIAGVRGFYWSNIDIANKTITLSTVLKDDSGNIKFGTEQQFDINDYWELGDIVSIHNDMKHLNCSAITSISGNTITVDSLPFTALKYEYDITDNAVFVQEKPDRGLVSFGMGAVAFGDETQAVNYMAFSGGWRNKSLGQFSTTFGRDNITGYCGLTFGRGNENHGDHSIVGGAYNKNFDKGYASAIFGDRNENYGDKSLLAGKGNKNLNTSGLGNTLVGRGNTINTPYGNSATFGEGNEIITNWGNSGAFGDSNIVKANAAFALGARNEVLLNSHNSFVAGLGNKASANGQAVVGKYNDHTIENLLFSVGNGTSDTTRSNALTVDKDGNTVVKNNLTSNEATFSKVRSSEANIDNTYGISGVFDTVIASKQLRINSDSTEVRQCRFKDKLISPIPENSEKTINCQFRCVDEYYDKIYMSDDSGSLNIAYGDDDYYAYYGAWKDEKYKIIEIYELPENEDDVKFLNNFLSENAEVLNCVTSIYAGDNLINIKVDEVKLSSDEVRLSGSETSSMALRIGNDSTTACWRGCYWDIYPERTDDNQYILTLWKDQACTQSIDSTKNWIKQGDYISLDNDHNYPLCTTVSSIGAGGWMEEHYIPSSYIVVPSLPFSAKADFSLDEVGLDCYSLVVPYSEHPEDAPIDFAKLYPSSLILLAAGQESVVSSGDSIGVGRNVKAIDRYAFVTGRDTVGTYGTVVGGRENAALGEMSAAFGQLNVTKSRFSLVGGKQNTLAPEKETEITGKNNNFGDGNIAWGQNLWIKQGSGHVLFGNSNTIDASVNSGAMGTGHQVYANAAFALGASNIINSAAHNSFVAGKNNVVSANSQCVVGMWNKAKTNSLFIVGGGNSESNRKNLFEVNSDQSIIAGHTHTFDSGVNLSGAFIGGTENKVLVTTQANNTQYKVASNCVIFGNNNTISTAYGNSGAMGVGNIVYDNASFAFGAYNTVLPGASNSFIVGKQNKVNGNSQAVVGRFNDHTIGNLLFSVGNGNSDTARSNAFTVDGEGNAVVKNNLTANEATLSKVRSGEAEISKIYGTATALGGASELVIATNLKVEKDFSVSGTATMSYVTVNNSLSIPKGSKFYLGHKSGFGYGNPGEIIIQDDEGNMRWRKLKSSDIDLTFATDDDITALFA